ncbi:rab-interacting lysosomal protein isoform X3 [Pteropus medius]|uniref:rab-interacting lysosomal protein isoform X3 n=1 Tax=Pteropus vampyrus TaxID=132908 RepID=UPI00196B4A9F|nr:rab-interacting lysosomal protein isoform X3 [Pteropus giganteus]
MEPRRAAPGAHGWGPRVAAGSATAAELVYHLAGALGTELKELARRFGPEAAAGLVPLVVQALELLEKAVVGPVPDSASAQQAELELRRLREENENLRRELLSGSQGECGPVQGAGSGATSFGLPLSNPPSSEERALLRQLKEVTDRQRDELRAHNRDLLQRSQETEALQEQLQRLLLVNTELRHKLAAVQIQLRGARDRESERELQHAGAVEPAQERAWDQAGGPGCEQRPEAERSTAGAGPPGASEGPADAPQQPGCPSNVGQCGFSREELEQILRERNELKANVFLLKEELAYFQRELLTDHRVPGLLLEAMKVAVRKQRKKIKAKMLGTPEEAESSDDEDGSWLLLSSDKGDYPTPPESRIQSFFGLCYRGEAEAPEAKTSSTASSELGREEEAPQQSHVKPMGSPVAPSS